MSIVSQEELSDELQVRYQNLLGILRNYALESQGLIVAYSGGVDSAFLLAAAAEVFASFEGTVHENLELTALTAISESFPDWDQKSAREIAQQLRVKHLELPTRELDNPSYRANQGDRCFHCKTALFDLSDWARKSAVYHLKGALVYGAITDDLGDDRPGMQAAKERHVQAPLIEANLDKQAVRKLSRFLKLPTWDKPASACLSSRFPTGISVSAAALRMVGQCESRMHLLGLVIVRARYHNELLRLEFGPKELQALFSDESLRQQVIKECKELGFKFVSIDLEGYRSGSGNQSSGNQSSGNQNGLRQENALVVIQ